MMGVLHLGHVAPIAVVEQKTLGDTRPCSDTGSVGGRQLVLPRLMIWVL